MTLSKRTINSINNVHQLQPLVIAVVFPSLATVAVVLRLISKRIIKASLRTDDYMILAALVCSAHCREDVIGELTARPVFYLWVDVM